MRQWIKLYTEALHDRKMRKLSRFDKSVFYDLLLLAGQDDNGGVLPDIEDIALELDLKKPEAQKSVENLIKAGIICKDINDNLMITRFQERQDSNLSGYERVKRYRETRKSVINDNVNDNADDNTMITNESYQEVINDNAEDTEMITVDKEIEIDKEIDINLTVNANALTDAEKSKSPKKLPFGSLKNVMLTEQENQKLHELFPDADEKIEAMSLYFGSKGNASKYKSHYATALNWARMAKERDKASSQAKPKEKMTAYEMLKAMGAS